MTGVHRKPKQWVDDDDAKGMALALSAEESVAVTTKWATWLQPVYTFRADDMLPMCDMLNTLSITCGHGCLFLSPFHEYDNMVGKLRDVDWSGRWCNSRFEVARHSKDALLTWFSNSISPDLFADGCIWHTALALFNRQPIRHVYFFVLRNEHWLLFEHNRASSSSMPLVYEPLKSHFAVDISVQRHFMRLLDPNVKSFVSVASFYILLPLTLLDKSELPYKGYNAVNLGVQSDSTSCGFWAIFIAIIRSISPHLPLNGDMLSRFDASFIRRHLRSLFLEYSSSGLCRETFVAFVRTLGLPNCRPPSESISVLTSPGLFASLTSPKHIAFPENQRALTQSTWTSAMSRLSAFIKAEPLTRLQQP
jgi:hypothetical protein